MKVVGEREGHPWEQEEGGLVTVPEEAFCGIKEVVFEASGLDIGNYKDKCIKRRIAVRVRALRCPDAARYLELLKRDRGELAKLLKALTINVTQFFRNSDTFEKIAEEVLPPLIEEKLIRGEEHLNIWSVGCSSGEEPYSLAILFREHFGEALKRITLQIMATDFDVEVIERGRMGIYDEKSLVETPPPLKKKYFIPLGEGRFQLSSEILRMVTFRQRNILEEKIYKGQDMILCRNMLIYFSRDYQEKILMKLTEALQLGGYLVLGKAEALVGETRRIYEPLCYRQRIYRKARVKGL